MEHPQGGQPGGQRFQGVSNQRGDRYGLHSQAGNEIGKYGPILGVGNGGSGNRGREFPDGEGRFRVGGIHQLQGPAEDIAVADRIKDEVAPLGKVADKILGPPGGAATPAMKNVEQRRMGTAILFSSSLPGFGAIFGQILLQFIFLNKGLVAAFIVGYTPYERGLW